MKYFMSLFCMVGFLVMFSGCTEPQPTATNPGPTPLRPLTAMEKQVVGTSSAFGWNLLRHADQEDPKTNVILSPLSVSMALGMTLNGARTTTETAMRQTLGFGGLSAMEINQSYRGLMDLLHQADPAVAMAVANSIWHRPDLSVEQDFIDVNLQYFDAQVRSLDFARADAADIINGWVKSKTGNKIETIVPNPIPSYAVMYLINAVYFKAPWTLAFDPNNTRNMTFTTPTGAVQAPLMLMHEKHVAYTETEDFQAVRLPYASGNFAMSVILPKDPSSIRDLISTLTPEKWEALNEGFAEKEGYLWMPRFTVTYDKALNDMLKAMGMEVAFDPAHADLSGIDRRGGLFISNVKHKTFVEVNEQGTEAAGATSVEVGRTSVDPEIFQMMVNRPFLFVIHEKHSGAILFLGKIVDPRQ